MTNDEERKYLIQQLQWERMKMNEWGMNFNIRFHELQTILQATIDHMEGKPDNDNTNN